MTNRKTTKRALFSSVISLILCLSMLVGTTFAWFTDSVSSGVNQIVAGNLDVELYYGKTEDPTVQVLNTTSDIFTDENGNKILWEPGVVSYTNLKVANLGSLALKYQLAVNFINENNVNGYKLSQILKVGVVEGGIKNAAEGREAVIAQVKTWDEMVSFAQEGKLLPVDKEIPNAPADAVEGSETYGIVIWWEPSSEDNNWNVNNGKKTSDGQPLHIDLGVNLVATQLVAEDDSFDNTYDEDADYLPAWDGETVTPVSLSDDGYYHITNGAELAYINTILAGLPAETPIKVVLDADINLGDEVWTPIGKEGNPFVGTFDGNGHTVYNVNVTLDNGDAGLFGMAQHAGVIKNLTLENVSVTGGERVAALIGKSLFVNIENCHVNNAVVSGESKVGALVGDLESAVLNGSTATNVTLVAEERVGGLAGRARNSEGGTVAVTNNVVENATITAKESVEKFVGENTAKVDLSTNVWKGEEEPGTTTNVYAVSSAAELVALGGRSLEGTIVLTADIDLQDADMPTIGAAYGKELTVLGNGYTISNAELAHTNHNGMKHYGLFYAYTNSTLTISDLVVENVNMDSSNDTERNYGVAVIVSFADGGSNVTLNNVDVNDCTLVNNKADIGDECAVYVGYQTGTLTMTDCDSTGCSVAGETAEKTGAFIGMVNGTATLNNCTTDLGMGACNRVSGTLTVNGGYIPKKYEASTDSELAEAIANSEDGVTTEVALAAGNYSTNFKVPGGKDVVISGTGADTVLSGQIATTASNEGTLTIKNVTINVDSSIKDSTGISQTGKSAIAVWGDQTVICENVTFNMSLADSTAITSWWDTGVGTTIIVRNCTFNCNGQRPIRATGNVTVEDCEFNDPYRYAVQLTAKTSTANLLEKAVVNFNNNTIVDGENGKALVYGIQLEGADYGCHDLVINGSGNTIVDGGEGSTMYYCECGKVDHATVEFNTEVEPVHEG